MATKQQIIKRVQTLIDKLEQIDDMTNDIRGFPNVSNTKQALVEWYMSESVKSRKEPQ